MNRPARILIIGMLLATVAPAGSDQVTQEPCSDVRVEASVFVERGSHADSWFENVDFDGRGGLWTSNLTAKRLERFDASGARTASIPLPYYPAGVRRGPDGSMYVGFIVFDNDPARIDRGGVFRVDPATLLLETVVEGIPPVNGLAFDDEGNLYLAHTSHPVVGRLTPDGVYDPEWAAVGGTNGLNVFAGALYATETFEVHSRVWRIPLARPEAAEVLVALSEPPLTWKWVDDGALGARGNLYLGTHATGELLRVDARTGTTCVLLSGLTNPTSARFADAFGDADPERDLFVSGGGGEILRVRISPQEGSS